MTDAYGLVAQIRANIAADCAAARAATPGPWTVEPADPGLANVAPVASDAAGDGCMLIEDARHIARQDPAATLARCEALKELVGLHAVSLHPSDPARDLADLALKTIAKMWP